MHAAFRNKETVQAARAIDSITNSVSGCARRGRAHPPMRLLLCKEGAPLRLTDGWVLPQVTEAEPFVKAPL
jgi:hypothetical protein